MHTDITAHSVDGFPGANGEEALGFFTAIKDNTLADYLSSHPRANDFVQTPKPTPASFGKEKYFGVNAFKFITPDNEEKFIRYRFIPTAGESYLDDATLKDKSTNFLFDELPDVLKQGAIEFKLAAQIAEPGDVTDDNTVKWPQHRKVVELGTIKLVSLAEDQAAQQKHIIFDPIPRVDGIEASDDPLLQIRAGVYLISGKERRAA